MMILIQKWIECQFTPEMNCKNIEIDQVTPIVSFDVSTDEGLREALNWKNTQPLLKKDRKHNGIKCKFLDDRLRFY